MARFRAVLFATAATVCVFASPAVAGSYAFDVYEGTVIGDNQYVLQNNTEDFYITRFIVTNPSPSNADANRANWGWDIFAASEPAEDIETLDAIVGCNGHYFTDESGFCYFDLGDEGFNPIAPGESQTFFFNGPLASSYALVFQDVRGTIFDCRGITNIDGCGAITTAAPEPATLAVVGSALGLLALRRRRKTV